MICCLGNFLFYCALIPTVPGNRKTNRFHPAVQSTIYKRNQREFRNTARVHLFNLVLNVCYRGGLIPAPLRLVSPIYCQFRLTENIGCCHRCSGVQGTYTTHRSHIQHSRTEFTHSMSPRVLPPMSVEKANIHILALRQNCDLVHMRIYHIHVNQHSAHMYE